MQNVYAQTGSLDQRCYTDFELTSEILMEHAGAALSKAVTKQLQAHQKALFVCGSGNNGADGIAAARMLHGAYAVAIYLPFKVSSSLSKLQLLRAQKVGVPIVNELIDADVYIDALFGAGLNRPLDEATCALIEELNAKKGYKIACDIPSGICNDASFKKAVFRADTTIVMGALKESLFYDSSKDAVGTLKVANLGVSKPCYETLSSTFLLQKKDLLLPFRVRKNTHKGEFGHVAIVAGEKEGAACLAGEGAFHFGAGLVTLIGNKPQKLSSYLMHSKALPKNCAVIVAGMGLEAPFDENAVQTLLLSNTLPLVIDASLSSHPLIQMIVTSNKPVVLTPHPKEFCAILKVTCQKEISLKALQNERFFYAREFSNRFPHLVLVLKGANTLIAHQGEIYINPFGTQALAKGGSGDVLSGMIGALIAQGYPIKKAAIQASLAHALVSKKLTCNNFSLTPKDIYKGLKWL